MLNATGVEAINRYRAAGGKKGRHLYHGLLLLVQKVAERRRSKDIKTRECKLKRESNTVTIKTHSIVTLLVYVLHEHRFR